VGLKTPKATQAELIEPARGLAERWDVAVAEADERVFDFLALPCLKGAGLRCGMTLDRLETGPADDGMV
jgi:hypothetical protein